MIKKIRPIKYILLLIVVYSLGGCTSEASSLDMVDTLPMYKGAYDVDKRKLDTESNQQLLYRLNKSYPSVDVLNFYDQYFMEHGWIKCSGNMETWKHGSLSVILLKNRGNLYIKLHITGLRDLRIN